MTIQRRTLDQWLALVADLAPHIRAAQLAADRDCRLPASLVEKLAHAGLFRMWLPARLGGLEVDPPTMLRVVEAVSAIDGSTGWCLGPGNVSSLMAAYLPEAAAKDVYGGDWFVNAAGSVAGSGRAVVVEAGYRLSGRWAFVTNSHWCPWLLGFFTVMEGDVPRCRPDGSPDMCFFYFPARDATILNTWDTGGLRGTASHDVIVEDVVVGSGYGFARDAKPHASGSLFRNGLSLWTQTAFAAVPLGIARAAIDALVELAQVKVPTRSRSLLREQPVLRYELAQADARLRAARSFFYEMVQGIWAAIESGQEVEREARALLGLACTMSQTPAERSRRRCINWVVAHPSIRALH